MHAAGCTLQYISELGYVVPEQVLPCRRNSAVSLRHRLTLNVKLCLPLAAPFRAVLTSQVRGMAYAEERHESIKGRQLPS